MVLKEIDCLLPEGMNRKDAETAIPKLVHGLGEVVTRAGDSSVFGDVGLSTIKYVLLHVLSEHETNPTMTELGKVLQRSPANLTQLVDDLEKQGWIQRLPAPEDRRVKRISLTDKGVAKLAEAEKGFAERMALFFEDYTDDEVTTLLSLLLRFGKDMLATIGIEGAFLR